MNHFCLIIIKLIFFDFVKFVEFIFFNQPKIMTKKIYDFCLNERLLAQATYK